MPRKKKTAKAEAEKTPLERARARMYYDLIFDTAEKIFAERGFDEATMQDLASAAGISPKTLYATFPGKNEIYSEILKIRGSAFLERVRGASSEGPALERLEGLTRSTVTYLIAHESFRRILLNEGRAWGLEAGRSDSQWREGLDTLASTLRQGMEECVFHRDDPELLAGTVQAILQVQLAGRLDRVEGEPDADCIADEILVILRRMLCCDPEQKTRVKAVA